MGRGFRRGALGRQGARIRRTSASSAGLGAYAARCNWKENGARSLVWGVALTPLTEVLPFHRQEPLFFSGSTAFERPAGQGPASGMVAEARGVGLPRARWRKLGSFGDTPPQLRLQSRKTPISEHQVSAWKRVGSSGFALWLLSPGSLSAPRAAFRFSWWGARGTWVCRNFAGRRRDCRRQGGGRGLRAALGAGGGFGRGLRGHPG